jgi:hypothetical protein
MILRDIFVKECTLQNPSSFQTKCFGITKQGLRLPAVKRKICRPLTSNRTYSSKFGCLQKVVIFAILITVYILLFTVPAGVVTSAGFFMLRLLKNVAPCIHQLSSGSIRMLIVELSVNYVRKFAFATISAQRLWFESQKFGGFFFADPIERYLFHAATSGF